MVCLTFFDAFLVSAFTAAAWFFFVAFAAAGAAFFAMMTKANQWKSAVADHK